jgi:hypothetical protein
MKLEKWTARIIGIVLLALGVLVLAFAARQILIPPRPTLAIIVVEPTRLIRIYAENFTSPPPNGVLANTLHIGNTTWEITSVDGAIVGTDVDISRLAPGVYDCWITDPYLGDSNHVQIDTRVSPVPEFGGPMIVAFVALAGSFFLLRRLHNAR